MNCFLPFIKEKLGYKEKMGLCASGSNKVYIDGYTPYEYYQDEWREQLKETYKSTQVKDIDYIKDTFLDFCKKIKKVAPDFSPENCPGKKKSGNCSGK